MAVTGPEGPRPAGGCTLWPDRDSRLGRCPEGFPYIVPRFTHFTVGFTCPKQALNAVLAISEIPQSRSPKFP